MTKGESMQQEPSKKKTERYAPAKIFEERRIKERPE